MPVKQSQDDSNAPGDVLTKRSLLPVPIAMHLPRPQASGTSFTVRTFVAASHIVNAFQN